MGKKIKPRLNLKSDLYCTSCGYNFGWPRIPKECPKCARPYRRLDWRIYYPDHIGTGMREGLSKGQVKKIKKLFRRLAKKR